MTCYARLGRGPAQKRETTRRLRLCRLVGPPVVNDEANVNVGRQRATRELITRQSCAIIKSHASLTFSDASGYSIVPPRSTQPPAPFAADAAAQTRVRNVYRG